MTRSLQEVWEGVLAGDPGAWESLVRRYNTLIISVARSHGLAAADLEDCAQQTWYALYTGRGKINTPLAIPTWLVRVAKRKAQRIQTRGKRRTRAEEQFEPASAPPAPDDLYLKTLESARIRAALEQLDPRCRQLLEKLFLSDDGWSYEQIAHHLGLATNSLGPIRSRCLGRLRKILEEMDPKLY